MILSFTSERPALAAGVLPAPPSLHACGEDGSPVEGAASFAVGFQDAVSRYRLISAFVMPQEELRLRAIGHGRFAAEADARKIAPTAEREWRWTAPAERGVHCLRVYDTTTGEAVDVRAFVLVPYRGSPTVGGYRIGSYGRGSRKSSSYERPRGFIEVTPGLADVRVSAHFRLGQFACKQGGSFPKYLALQTRLLLELEALLERAKESGLRATTFSVMSGYRTPFYNRAIGNRTAYSRHLYGDAADIFIDEDGDGRMDDLNRDGRITSADARVLYRLVERMHADAELTLAGGLGLYGPAHHHGPFVHVDTRGHPARW